MEISFAISICLIALSAISIYWLSCMTYAFSDDWSLSALKKCLAFNGIMQRANSLLSHSEKKVSVGCLTHSCSTSHPCYLPTNPLEKCQKLYMTQFHCLLWTKKTTSRACCVSSSPKKTGKKMRMKGDMQAGLFVCCTPLVLYQQCLCKAHIQSVWRSSKLDSAEGSWEAAGGSPNWLENMES